MQKPATQRIGANLTAHRRAKPTIIFRKRRTASTKTQRSERKSRSHLDQVVGAGRPVNQRFCELQNTDSFSPTVPVRPLKSHAMLARDQQLIESEIDALRELIRVNVSSIARRTSEPQDLMWPLLHGLAIVVCEFIDEESRYEMSALEDGLKFLEFVTHGKLSFAR